MSVKRAQREIDSQEFTEWMAYAALEPFGETRADLRAGIVASTIANVWRSGESEPFTPGDFMPTFEPQEPEPVERDAEILHQQQLFEALTQAVGGTIH